MFTSASRPNRLILPRIRSETRGLVTPKSLAVCAWLMWVRVRWFFSAVSRTERSFMFSASSGVSSMASQTLANRWLLIVLAPSTSHGNAWQPSPDQLCWSFFCLLLETVTHVDGISELGNVDDPKRPGSIPNPNFLHALAHGVHGLPVVRFLSALYLVELMTCLAPGRKRKSAKVIKGVAPKLDGLGIGHAAIIQNFVFFLARRIRKQWNNPPAERTIFPFSETTPGRTQPHVFRFFRGVLDGIPDAGNSLIAHWPGSFNAPR